MARFRWLVSMGECWCISATYCKSDWIYLLTAEKTHPKEQLEAIGETEFSNLLEKLTKAYPEYNGDFEVDIRGILLKRWENLIAIKKEHIEEEIEEIYIAGLKPSFVKRIYKEFHGIS